jgi:branched-chain amino acid transport system substrate-binding protein
VGALFVVSCNRQNGELTQQGGQNGVGQPSGGSIKVGAVLPLTGDSAAWGEQGKYGIQMAADEINAAGGINGRKLEVVYEDSRAEPRTAVSAIQKLTSVDKVPAIVGDITSGATLAMAPIAERSQTVLIAPTASAPAISQAGNYIYRVWPSDTLEGSALAEHVAKSGFKRAAILHIQTDYGTGLRDVFTAVFKTKSGQVVLTQGYNQDETNFEPLLLKVSVAKPDAVYVVGYYKDTALILKQARAMGLKVQFFGATAAESPELLKIAGSAAQGLIYPIISDFDPANPTPRAKEFIAKFTKKFGKAPDWASSHTHDAIIVMAQAMKKGGASGPDIMKAIDSTRQFEGVTGKIIFDANGDVIDKPVVIKTVRGGKFVILKTAS